MATTICRVMGTREEKYGSYAADWQSTTFFSADGIGRMISILDI